MITISTADPNCDRVTDGAGYPSAREVIPGGLNRTRARKRSAIEREEVDALLQVYVRTRDIRIRNRLVSLHERLVRSVAMRFTPGWGNSVEDLVQVGTLGLIEAITRFDPSRGYTFTTFAVPTIEGVIKRHLRDQCWMVKAPRQLRQIGVALPRLRERLEQRLGRAPFVSEMAEAARVTEEELLQAMDLNLVGNPASLDAARSGLLNEEAKSLHETVGEADTVLSTVVEREWIRSAMQQLDTQQRDVIYHRFFRQASQTEVARKLSISQMQVSRLERQAMQRLRTILSGMSPA